jgi:hypothetical protein
VTWWSHIARRRVSLGFVLRIRGIPTLFASFDSPGAPWLSYGGVAYAWHRCLTLDDIGDVATEIDPWTGRPVVGEISVGFTLTDTIRALLDFELAASESSTVVADALSVDGTIEVDDESPFIGASLAYCGVETMRISGTAAGELTVDRGAFGSRAMPIFTSAANIQEFGTAGPLIATRPLTFEGRAVDLWAVPMVVRDGLRTPYGANLADQANQLISTGPLFSFVPSYGNGTATLSWNNLAKLCDGGVYTRYPKAVAGHGMPGYIQLDNDNCWIAFAAMDRANRVRGTYVRRLQRDNSGSPEDVPRGLWSIGNIGRWIAYTIEQATAVIGEDRSVYGAANNFLDDGRVQLTITVRYEYVAEWAPALQLLPCPDSLWPELGFGDAAVSADVATPQGSGTSSSMRLVYEANDPPPTFRLTYRGLRRIYYRDRGEEAFSVSLNVTDALGVQVLAHALVGEEIVEVSGSGSIQPDGLSQLAPVPYLEISRRGACQTAPAELSADDDEELRQVLAFPGVPWGKVLLYLMASGIEWGGTYSRFWRGAGPGIDLGSVDTASFLAIGAEPRDIVITEATTIGDVLGILLPQAQCAVIADTAIRLIDLDPITDDEADTATAIDHDDCDESWPTFDAGVDRIVNVVRGRNLGYNPGSGDGLELPYTQATSTGTWGHQQALDLDCRWCGSAEQSEGVLAQAFDRLVSKFGSRYATSAIGLRNAVKAWSVQPGKAVVVSHPALPDGAGGLGMVSRLARVWRVSRKYQGAGSRGQLTVAFHDLDRSTARCRWAPGALGYVSGLDEVTCSPASEAGFFESGMELRISERASAAASVATVLSVSGAVVRFTKNHSLTGNVLLEFAEWAGATTKQRRLAYLGRKRWS